ncbi:cytochrome P450 [Aspergillus unguis]
MLVVAAHYELTKHYKQQTLVARTLILSLLIGIVTILIYRIYLHPRATVPGPKWAKVTGLWRSSRYIAGKWHEDILALHDTYGPVVRIAPNEVSVVGAAPMKQIYGHGTSSKKSDWYHTWHTPGVNPPFFAETDRKLHSLKRRRVSAAYSMTAILRYEPYIQACMDLCLSKLRAECEAGNVVDISEWTQALVFDVVGELAYGEQLGHLRAGAADVADVRVSIASSFWIAANLGHFWGQTRLIFDPVLGKIMKSLGVSNGVVDFIDWTKERIANRKANPDKVERSDMLAYFLSMKGLDGSGEASSAEILVEALNIVMAGADTTSAGMRASLYFIGTSPVVYQKLQAAVDEYYEAQGLHLAINYKQTQEIPYLQAVITEALRLSPPINFQLLRDSPAGGITIDKYYIPPGCRIGMSAAAQNRDPDVYGCDRNAFRPERWLEDPAVVSRYESGNMTFGGNGPRTCIGRNIAIVEISKFLAQFVRQFDFEFVNKRNPWTVTSAWSAHPHNMHVKLAARQMESDC